MSFKIKNILVFILAIFIFSSCSNKTADFKRVESKGLSKKAAEHRAKYISDVEYNFSVDLSKADESDSYSGVSAINFNLKKPVNFTIDFVKGEVITLIINKKKIDKFEKNDHFIAIDKEHLLKGANSIAISFNQEYSTTGSGLYKFTDAEDDNTYVYTDFEPYDANDFVPLFDQPNLKATYSLNVLVPDSWKVISSVKENRKAIRDKSVQWFFPKSEKFSTYIFPLHAGPYSVWRKNAKVNGREIPMGLFARKSLATYVRPDFWFKITESGFNYFENYFSTKYPYQKYDQILVPDFNSGAMENVAAVTFNERNVSRDKKPLRAQRAALANVIMHEMAHMWFGNLVTMNWWNDLWLNESFATFMANSATYDATEFKEAWLTFFNRTKQWAYSEDQWRTTHPIEAEIASTEVALTNFDGITYGKGASSLKQLVFLIGVENFKKGLASYFSKYAEKNTELKDFISELQKNTKEDLSQWTKLWLQKEGLNSVKSKINCSDEGILKDITFEQGFVSGKEVLRPHKTKIALWTSSSVEEKPSYIFDFKYEGKSNVWKPSKSLKCPVAVFPNWEDHDYVKVVLDEKSLKAFSGKLSKIESPLLRSQVWASLWSMVRMAELEPKKMHEIVLNQMAQENDNVILISALNQIIGVGGYSDLYYYYKENDLAKKDKQAVVDFFKAQMIKTSDLDAKKIFFTGWVYLATEKSLASVKSCLKKCDFNIGFEIDPDRRWLLIQKLAEYRDKDFNKVLKAELKNDKSRNAQLYALSSKVLYSKDKKEWLSKIFDKDSSEEFALKEKMAIMRSIVPDSQKESYLGLIEESFNTFSSKINNEPSRIQRSFGYYFAPYFCGDKKSKSNLSDSLIKKSDWSPSFKKTLLQGLDREERCLKIKS